MTCMPHPSHSRTSLEAKSCMLRNWPNYKKAIGEITPPKEKKEPAKTFSKAKELAKKTKLRSEQTILTIENVC